MGGIVGVKKLSPAILLENIKERIAKKRKKERFLTITYSVYWI